MAQGLYSMQTTMSGRISFKTFVVPFEMNFSVWSKPVFFMTFDLRKWVFARPAYERLARVAADDGILVTMRRVCIRLSFVTGKSGS